MTKVIKKVQTNEEFVLSLLKNQTSVLDATINVVKKTRATSDKRLRLLKQQVAAIAESRGKYTGSRLTETYPALTTQLINWIKYEFICHQIKCYLSHHPM
ncbi:hypothetical protein ACLKA6_013297 [Drosophila palustris]